MIFYTYLWLREDGTPYYVGKGTRYRAFAEHRIAKPPVDRILLEPHISEADAFESEKFLIAYYGRLDLGTGCLRNLTDGGEGCTGAKLLFTTEHKERLSASAKVKKFSAQQRQRMRESRKKFLKENPDVVEKRVAEMKAARLVK